jgi:hypothetical protein
MVRRRREPRRAAAGAVALARRRRAGRDGEAALRFDHAEVAQLHALLGGTGSAPAPTADEQIDRLLERTGGRAPGCA